MTVEELIQELEKLPKYLDVEIQIYKTHVTDIRIIEDNQGGIHTIVLTNNG